MVVLDFHYMIPYLMFLTQFMPTRIHLIHFLVLFSYYCSQLSHLLGNLVILSNDGLLCIGLECRLKSCLFGSFSNDPSIDVPISHPILLFAIPFFITLALQELS